MKFRLKHDILVTMRKRNRQTGTLTERSARLTKRDRQKLRLRQRRETERRERQ